MRINAITNAQNNPNFNAKLYICKYPEKVLQAAKVEALEKKAATLGTNKDSIRIAIYQRPKDAESLQKGQQPKEFSTYIPRAMHTFKINEPAADIVDMAEVHGDSASRAEQMYNIIDAYLTGIANGLKKNKHS